MRSFVPLTAFPKVAKTDCVLERPEYLPINGEPHRKEWKMSWELGLYGDYAMYGRE